MGFENGTTSYAQSVLDRKNVSDRRIITLAKSIVALQNAHAALWRYERSFAYALPGELFIDREIKRTRDLLARRMSRLTALLKLIEKGTIHVSERLIDNQCYQDFAASMVLDSDEDDQHALGWQNKELEDIYG